MPCGAAQKEVSVDMLFESEWGFEEGDAEAVTIEAVPSGKGTVWVVPAGVFRIWRGPAVRGKVVLEVQAHQ